MDCDGLGIKGILPNFLLLFQITKHNETLLINAGLKNVNHVKAKTNKNQQTGLTSIKATRLRQWAMIHTKKENNLNYNGISGCKKKNVF